ncbi:hypothetical protein [Rubritalea tangerina]|uniref:hypothetical protein n=1 Tax=Rubritalea tangerina TaxID=430798 RepID=UPI00360EAE61
MGEDVGVGFLKNIIGVLAIAEHGEDVAFEPTLSLGKKPCRVLGVDNLDGCFFFGAWRAEWLFRHDGSF